ncbi:MAG: hypothetical protein ACRD25_01780 [Terracidiphilus sp.]
MKILQEFVPIEIRQPCIDDHRFRHDGFRLGPRFGAAFGLAHLPAQSGKNRRQAAAEIAVGARYQGRAQAQAIGNGRPGKRNRLHTKIPFT